MWDQPQPPFLDAINNDVRGPVFDLGIELEYYTGPIYLRADHVADMAKALGFIEGSVHNELKEKYQSLVEYTDSLMEVESLADRLRSVLDISRPDDSEPDSAPVDDPQPEPGDEGIGLDFGLDLGKPDKKSR